MVTCEARWTGPLERAVALRDAIIADDPGMFEVELIAGKVSELCVRTEAESIATLQATMDDLLACLAAAEVSLDAVQD